MTERDQVIDGFLATSGWSGAVRAMLAGDASFRRYERVTEGTRHAVLMDAPPPQEDVRPFLAVAAYLTDQGYSAPKVFAAAPDDGLLLLEDLGDSLFSRVLQDGRLESALYEAAIDLLCDLHQRPPPEGLAPYDDAVLLAEADLFIDWYLPAIGCPDLTTEARAAYHELWRAAFGTLEGDQPVLVLRDFHADNLVWLPDRVGAARVGLLDFQDALIGSPAYDLVSLIEDARRDVATCLGAAMVDRYLASRPQVDGSNFRAALAILGAQRNAKIIGIFTRLSRRDYKSQYLNMIPHVWRLLERDLSHPALVGLRAWFDRMVPAARRLQPSP